jgi:hypothetical protein
LKLLNADLKHATLVTITCCILHNFCRINHDICHSDVVGMQDFHPNLNVNRGLDENMLQILPRPIP